MLGRQRGHAFTPEAAEDSWCTPPLPDLTGQCPPTNLLWPLGSPWSALFGGYHDLTTLFPQLNRLTTERRGEGWGKASKSEVYKFSRRTCWLGFQVLGMPLDQVPAERIHSSETVAKFVYSFRDIKSRSSFLVTLNSQILSKKHNCLK